MYLNMQNSLYKCIFRKTRLPNIAKLLENTEFDRLVILAINLNKGKRMILTLAVKLWIYVWVQMHAY